MKDLTRQKFEEDWRAALHGAEVEPPTSIWSNLELDLMHVESNSMRKKVIFYKWLAAASVIVVVFLGGAYYFNSSTDNAQIATSNKSINDATQQNRIVQDEKDQSNPPFVNSDIETADIKESGKQFIKSGKTDDSKYNTSNVVAISDEKESLISQSELDLFKHSSRTKVDVIATVNIVKEVPAIVHGKIVLPRLVLPAISAVFMNSSKKNKQYEDLWASVGMSAGSYNPGSATGSQAFKASSSPSSSYLNSVGDSNPSSVGSAYSAGFGISKRVFSRWVLQSGVNYINQSIGYTSNYVSYAANNQSKAFVAEYADFANQTVTITSPYEINSTVEVVSLPVQTGYLVVDRKIGWQMNTGVAADFFVRNTLTDESGQVGSFSQSSGEDSPYRPVSWSGLLGTEVSYKVAKQYRISVAPSMRYSMNSVLKSTSGNVSNPLVMDIGFRFRYIFK